MSKKIEIKKKATDGYIKLIPEVTAYDNSCYLTRATAQEYELNYSGTSANLFDKVFRKNDIKSLRIVILKKSTDWIAPRAKGQLFRVFAVGGGGGGNMYVSPSGGAGSGYVNIKTI